MSAEEEWRSIDELRRAEVRLLLAELDQVRAELDQARMDRDVWRATAATVLEERDHARESAAHYRQRCADLRRERRRGWSLLGASEVER